MKSNITPFVLWTLMLVGCSSSTSDNQPEVDMDGGASRIVHQVDPKPLVQATSDDFGNLYKAIVKNSQAKITVLPESDARLVRDGRLGETLYLFESPYGDWLKVGGHPSGKAEGYIRAINVFVTSHQEVLRLRNETLPLRKLAALYHDEDRFIKAVGMGQSPGLPTWREMKSDSSGRMPPLPVLAVRDVEVNGTIIRIVKLATWTWDSQDLPGRVLTHIDKTQTREKLKQLDLLLFVDATGSMSEVWIGLQSYITRILNAVDQLEDIDIAVSVIAYRDHRGSSWLVKTQPLTKDLSDLQARIDVIDAGEGGDQEEAMFDAILHGLENIEWRSRSARYGIVIANSGSHVGDDQNPRSLTLESICSNLNASRVQISCLQMPCAEPNAETLLKQQMKTLASQTDGQHWQYSAALSPSLIMDHVKKIINGQQFENQQQLAIYDKVYDDGLTLEEVQKELNIPGPVFERLAANLGERVGTDLTKIQVRGLGSVGYEAGWTIYDPTTWELSILMTQDDCQTLVKVVDNLITLGAESPDKLMAAWEQALGAVLGESLEEEVSLSLKARGIPLRPDSLLRFNQLDFGSMPRSTRIELVKQLEKRFEKLVSVSGSQRPNDAGVIVLPANCLP